MNTSAKAHSPILVTGATGTVGRHVVRQLVDRGEPVRAGTRNPDRYEGPRGAEAVHLDMTNTETWGAALGNADRAFVLSPSAPAAHEKMAAFIHHAAESGVRRLVLMTAMGVEHGPDDDPLRRSELAAETNVAEAVVLRPNWFMQNFVTFWRGMIEADGVLRLPAGEGATSFVDAIDIARVATAALTDVSPSASAYTLTGPQAHTYTQAADILSEAWDRTIRYESIDDRTAIDLFRTAGLDQQYAEMLTGLFEAVRAGHTAPVSTAVEDVTGRSARTLRDFAASTARVMA